jgi:hypothetical protein
MATETKKAKDAQYKDGYQVAEGGDYLVHKVNPEDKSQYAEHQVSDLDELVEQTNNIVANLKVIGEEA